MLSAFSPPCLYFSFVYCLSTVWLPPSFIRLYVRTLPKFQNLPKLKSTNNPLFISILALTYLHFFSFICSFIVRSLFVHCSFIVRSLFVFPSSFVRLSFVFCSSHFLVTTLPLLGRSLRKGEYVIGERIFCSSFHYLPVRLAPSFVRLSYKLFISTLFYSPVPIC